MVIDCSVVLAWFLPDEQHGNFDSILDIVQRGRTRALVPRIWAYEIHSSLGRKVRQNRFTWDAAKDALEKVWALPFELQNCTFDTPPTFPSEAFSLVEKHNSGKPPKKWINFFDVQYLLLARDQGMPLAVLDEPLAHAAESEGVKLVISIEDIVNWKKGKPPSPEV